MKTTAIEWLTNKLRVEFGFAFSDNILEQAKEIEKQQIIDAYGVKVNQSIEQGTTVYIRTFGGEYYNETYKK